MWQQYSNGINVAFVVDTKGKALSEVANFPVISPTEVAQTAQEREPEPENEWSGNIGKLGRVEHDLRFDHDGG